VQSGVIVLLPTARAVPPFGFALFSYRNNGVTVAEASIPAMDAAKAFRLYAESSGGFDKGEIGSIETGLAVVNRSNEDIRISVEVYRLDGSPAGNGTLVIPRNGQIAKFLHQIEGLEMLPSPFQGIVRVVSPNFMSVAGLRVRFNERNDFLITGNPTIAENFGFSTELFFPHFPDGGGYTTQFILISGPQGQLSAGSLRLFSGTGEALHPPLR
jgi:hypothetical protein